MPEESIVIRRKPRSNGFLRFMKKLGIKTIGYSIPVAR
jgi:hypothetical protein